MNTKRMAKVLAAVLLALLQMGLGSAAQGITEIIALSGNAAPDGNGAFFDFGVPALNASGQAAFFAELTGTSGGASDDQGLFLGAGGAVTQIARAGQAAPDGNGAFFALTEPALNASGQAAFSAGLTGTSDDSGIFLGAGGAVTQIARTGQTAPDGTGAFSGFGISPALNASGQAAFTAGLTGTSNNGIFLGAGGAVTQIARAGQAAPDGNGAFSFFEFPALNASGQAAFSAGLTGTSGESDNQGIFLGAGGAVTQIARTGQAAPDGNGAFSEFFNSPALNASGQAAFQAGLTGTSGGSGDNSGIFLGAGGAVTQIARAGQAAPDGNGALSGFGNPALNASGQAAFQAILTGTSDDIGIFLGDGGAVTQIARRGQAAPDGNGAFSFFGIPALNASGQVAFFANLNGTSDDQGIFLANGMDILQVARSGDALAGSTILSLGFNDNPAFNGDERSGMNDAGQVAYLATLANGGEAIVRFTIPDIHWTAAGSGNWTADANWTQGTEPNSFHDTFIDPATSLTVTAPTTNKTVASLTLGGGSGVATLRLAGATTGDLRALEASSIESSGVLHLADDRTFSAPTLANRGTIRGDGTVDALLTNDGRIESIGQELAFSKLVTNNASTGSIAGENATFRFDGGLTNAGSIGVSFGTSRFFGDIDNPASGNISVGGGAGVTFYDDLDQNGTLVVAKVGNTTSVAVLFGAFSGAGGFIGGGDVFVLGDLAPGNSPANVLMDGNLFMGPSTHTLMELGGLVLGDQYDHLNVTGVLGLDGLLEVLLIDGFAPGAGESFDLFDFGTLSGTFAQLDLPALGGGLDWDTSQLYTTGVLSVVPEPTSLVLFALALPLVYFRRRSTRTSQPTS